jgi:glyoxalase superfamily protein
MPVRVLHNSCSQEVDLKIVRRVVVFDADDIEAESTFWAGLLGGTVHRDEDWRSIVVDGEWIMGVQRAPNHVPPDWPAGPQQQQMHIDLHVDDLQAAERLAVELGGRQLQAARRPADNPDGDEMFAVYASPAGHPFCFGVH